METTSKESAPLTVTYPGAAYWAFGDNPQMADELGALVVGGIKTATFCSLQAYQQDASSPRIGDYSVILDGRERPLAVIRTTALRLLRFCDVTAEMAAKEGEGDLSLAYWRETHRAFFERAGHWSEEMALVGRRVYADGDLIELCRGGLAPYEPPAKRETLAAKGPGAALKG